MSFAKSQANKEKHLITSHKISALKENNNLDKQQVIKAENILNELERTPIKSDKTKELVKSIYN